MPVITVTAPALPTAADEQRGLAQLACAVAEALGLAPRDVQATCVHTATAVLGAEVVEAWPVVVLHGRRRPTAQLAAALAEARRCVAQGWTRDPDEVWVQWLLADDLSTVGAP